MNQLLAKGLQAGYGGGTVFGKVDRGGFELKTSHFVDTDGGIYHDEWCADGDWKYVYKVTDQEESIPVISGKESIFYKNDLVFVYVFILCPVE